MLLQLLLCLSIGLRVGIAGPPEAPKCGGKLPPNKGSFQTPGYPIVYPDDRNCTWTIDKPTNSSVLHFVDFEVEEALSGPLCQFDYVTVTIGSGSSATKVGPLCGYTPPKEIPFHDSVKITFISDRIRAYKGFLATYYAVGEKDLPSTPTPETTTTREETNTTETPYPCIHVLNGTSGEIKSPNYPHNYSDNLGCSWTIHPPTVQSVLTFKDFDVEKQNWGEPCQFDYVYVFVGTGSHVKSHGPYCGNTSPPPVKYNETIQVTFTTDKNVTGKGFRLTFGPAK